MFPVSLASVCRQHGVSSDKLTPSSLETDNTFLKGSVFEKPSQENIKGILKGSA